jgi:DHA2 family multidrug resistance protein
VPSKSDGEAKPAAPSEKVSRRDWIAVMGGMLGAFMAVLDIQITNSSLRDIQGGLAASLDEGTWISTSYLVAEIIVIPLTGWLSGVFGLRRYLIANSALFVVFSVIAGLSASLPMMILARAAQGFTGGVLIPTAFTVALLKLPPSKRNIGLALFGFTATFAPAIGPTLGGWLTDSFGWEYIFFINVVPGAIMIAALGYGLDRAPMRLAELKGGDWFGIFFMALGLGTLIVVLEEGQRKDWFGSDLIFSLAMISAASLVAFLAIEFVRKKPFINLRLLANGSLASACVLGLLLGLGLYGSVYVLPVYLSQIQGYNAMQIGEVIMWLGMPQLFVLPFLPRLMARFDARILLAVGLLLFAGSCFMNAFMNHDYGIEELKWAQLVRALGQPLVMIPLSSLATAGIARADVPTASAMFNIMRNLGGSIGIAALSTFVTRREQYHFQTIAESITQTRVAVQGRLDVMTQFYAQVGGNEVANLQSIAYLRNLVRREAFVMSYSDAFFVIGLSLALGVIAILFLAKPAAGSAPAGH